MRRIVATLCMALLALPVYAQGVRLSDEQQRMLDQLPPAQRQQALEALGQLESRQTPPPQTINEPIGLESQSVIDGVQLEPEEPRVDSRSNLVIEFSLRDDLQPSDRQRANSNRCLRWCRLSCSAWRRH